MQNKKIAIGMVTNSYLSLIIFVLEVFSYLSSFPLAYLLFPVWLDSFYSKIENLTILGSLVFVEEFRCHRKTPIALLTCFINCHRTASPPIINIPNGNHMLSYFWILGLTPLQFYLVYSQTSYQHTSHLGRLILFQYKQQAYYYLLHIWQS